MRLLKDDRTDDQVLNDCIKFASWKVDKTNNADNRMVLDALIEKQISDKKKNEFAMVEEDTQEQKYKDALIGISDYLQDAECHCLVTRDIQGNFESKVQCMKCDILEWVNEAI